MVLHAHFKKHIIALGGWLLMYTSGPPRPPVWQKTIFFPDFFFATFPNTFKHKFNISLFQPVKASSQSMPRMPQNEKGKSGKGGNGKKVRGLLFDSWKNLVLCTNLLGLEVGTPK